MIGLRDLDNADKVVPPDDVNVIDLKTLRSNFKKVSFGDYKGDKIPIFFDLNIVSAQRQWLLNHFHGLGFLYASIKSETSMHEDNNVFLVWRIDPGQKILFGKTVVLGSNTFPFAKIIRELAHQPGAVWAQDQLRQSFLRLKELEVFEMIHLYPDQTVQMAQKPIMLKLQKDDPFEIRARAGFELQHVRKYQTFAGVTYKIGGTFLVKNPLNIGDQLRIDADFTRSHREVVARYQRPWIFSLPIRTIFQGYSIKYNHSGFIGSKKDVYTITQQGFLIGMRRKTIHAEGGVNIGVEWMETSIKDTILAESLAKAINFEPQLLDKTIPFFFLEPTMFIDYLDHKLNPTRGTLTIVSLKGMFPLETKHADSYFVKLLIEQSLFIPLRSLVFALRLRFGHIFHRKFCSIMPTERFYLGGSHSLRGYQTDLTLPLGIFIDEDNKKRVVPRGGKSMVNANVEIRFPLLRKMGGVLFQDLGMLSGDNFADFKANNVLAATGFGVRFYTPLGPLRFDIGWKWRKQDPAERSYAWFLSFGHAF